MIEAEREEHDVANDDLIAAHDGFALHLVDAEDRDLGEVDDGGGEEAALLAEGGDGEGAADQVLELQAALADIVREAVDLAGEIGERPLAGLLDHGYHQSAFGRGRPAALVVAR